MSAFKSISEHLRAVLATKTPKDAALYLVQKVLPAILADRAWMVEQREYIPHADRLDAAADEEWFDHETEVLRQMATNLRLLDTEVTRLRSAIGLFRYGRMELSELCRIAETWDGSGASALTEENVNG